MIHMSGIFLGIEKGGAVEGSDGAFPAVEGVRLVRHRPCAHVRTKRKPRRLNRRPFLDRTCGSSTFGTPFYRILRTPLCHHTRMILYARRVDIGCRRRQKSRGVGVADGEPILRRRDVRRYIVLRIRTR